MLNSLISLLAIIALAVPLHAQSIAKKVDPGGPVPLEWTFAVSQEMNITGFKIYTAPAASGPWTFNGSPLPASLRTVTVPANFAVNTVRIFYRMVAFKTAGSESVESSVAVADREVELNVPSPTGLLVK